MIRSAVLAVALLTCACSTPGRPNAATPSRVATPPRVVIDEQAWMAIAPNGRILATPHWRLYTTAPPLGVIDRSLPALLESALATYTTRHADLPRPNRAMEMFVLASRPQWARLTRRLAPEDAPQLLRIDRGGYTVNARSVLFDIGPRDTLALATHEGWHLYTQSVFADPLPLWLEEGVAVSMEGMRTDPDTGRPRLNAWANVERFDQLRVAEATGSLLSLSQVLDSSPAGLLHARGSADTALTWYAQTWALVHFLREHADGRHRAALATLLQDAAEGRLSQRLGNRALAVRNGRAVFAAYFDDDLVRADQAYRAFIRELVRTGAKDRIVAGRSPIRERSLQ
ncbi:MAG: hypothetical protein AAGK04_07825 [Planctomycetota bacterium]